MVDEVIGMIDRSNVGHFSRWWGNIVDQNADWLIAPFFDPNFIRWFMGMNIIASIGSISLEQIKKSTLRIEPYIIQEEVL